MIDGLADRPVRALGGRTPLKAAQTPTLDRLATEGQSGLADPVAPGVVPDTAAGTLALFGQSPAAMNRGPVEALGAGIELRSTDVAVRGKSGDGRPTRHRRRPTGGPDSGGLRRVGGSSRSTAAVGRTWVRTSRCGSGRHRASAGNRPARQGTLLGYRWQRSGTGGATLSAPHSFSPRPEEPGGGANRSKALVLFEQKARRVLSRHHVNMRRQEHGEPLANTVLTRGAGRVHRLVQLEEAGIPLRISCVAGDRTVLGLAGWLRAPGPLDVPV